MNGEIKSRISGQRIIEAYDKDGRILGWSGLPGKDAMPVSDAVAMEVYKRQLNAATVKIYE